MDIIDIKAREILDRNGLQNIKIVEAFLSAKENTIDPVYKARIDQIVEYEND